MTDDELMRICAVCGRTLEEYHDGAGLVLYRHSLVDQALGEGDDHPPVAVRYSDAPAQAQFRCDFCLDEPVTHTLVLDKELGIPGVILWSKEWAMCDPCSILVISEQWADLKRRAFAKQSAQFGPMHPNNAMNMRVVFRDMKRSVVMIYREQ